MAEPIVRKFVIDTGESEQNLKELNTQINATSSSVSNSAASLNQVAAAEDNVAASSKSLKAQLRELQAQLANTDPQTDKYRELSAAAGELKDKIQDASQAVGTQAGGAFEKVSGSLGLVTSRIANLDFEGAAEGAKLLAKNITEIKPGDIANGVKSIGSAFASIGKALLTNPIFLIGAAIAAAIVYSEELLSLIDGVTDAEQEALEAQKERAAFAKKEFDDISKIENSLRLQGKTEREILDIKIAKVGEAIVEQKAIIETLKLQKQQQVEAAKRNRDILKGLLDFISIPLTGILAGVDLITAGLNKAGLISDETFSSIGNLRDKYTSALTALVFNPEEVAAEGDKAIAAAEDTLKDLESQRDGFLLNIKDMEKKAADDRSTARQKELEEEQKVLDAIAQSKEEQYQNSLDQYDKEARAIDLKYKNLIDQAKAAGISTVELQKLYDAEIKALNEKQAADELLQIQKDNEAKAAADKAYYDELAKLKDDQYASTLSAQDAEELAVMQKYDALYLLAGDNAARQKEITDQQEAELNVIREKYRKEDEANQKASEEKKRQEQLATVQSGLEWAEKGLNATQALTDAVFANRMSKVKKGSKAEEELAKKQFSFNKKLQLGGAIIDAAKAVTASLSQAPVAIGPLPNPAGIASLALATATGVANIAKIASTKFEGGSAGGSDTPTPSIPGGGGPSEPAQFNPLAASFLQQRQEQITPRAYVLAGDVASAAEVRENVADLARIG